MQVAKAVAVADEAVGNMSTVRAFAMEGMETELYNKEVNESCRQNQKLGLGIGMFQGLANFALNGEYLEYAVWFLHCVREHVGVPRKEI